MFAMHKGIQYAEKGWQSVNCVIKRSPTYFVSELATWHDFDDIERSPGDIVTQHLELLEWYISDSLFDNKSPFTHVG